MIGRVIFFIGATLLAGAAVALIVWKVWKPDEVVADAVTAVVVAVFVCLVPAVITLLISEWALSWPPEYQVAAILGGTGIRIFVVALTAFLLFMQVPWLREESGFWTWVLIFYGVTLALEVGVILRAQAIKNPPAPKSAEQTVPAPE